MCHRIAKIWLNITTFSLSSGCFVSVNFVDAPLTLRVERGKRGRVYFLDAPLTLAEEEGEDGAMAVF